MRQKQLPPKAYADDDSVDYSENSYSSAETFNKDWGTFINPQLRESNIRDLQLASSVVEIPSWQQRLATLKEQNKQHIIG